ncbi:MAG TPA: TolC family protein, partial [Kofleriaceae bacterium]|nr:TolC family protein [Kofleriaceae bacterium]
TTSGQSARHDPRAMPFIQELMREQATAAASVTKPLRDGGRLAVQVEADEAKVTSFVPEGVINSNFTQTTMTPLVEARWDEPLLGGRIAGPAHTAALDALHGAAELDELATAEQVVRDVERAYWQLYLAQQELAIFGGAVALAQGQLDFVRAEIARGTRAPLAAAEVEEELARRREDELVARGALAERSLALAQLLGLPPDSELAAADTPRQVAPGARADIVRAALAHSPKLRAASARGDAAGFELAKAEDDGRWRLDAYLSGTLSAPADRTRDALYATAGYGGWTIEAGFTLKLPLGDATARGKRDGARARLVGARIEVADVAAEVASAATRAANQLELAGARRLALARSVELAQQNLDAEHKRWQRGDGTSFELLRRQAAVADAQLREARARVDELSAAADVDALTGELLARDHVAIAGASEIRE